LPRSRGDTDRKRAIAEHRSTVGMAAYSVRENWKFEHHEAYFYVRYLLDAVTTITPTGGIFCCRYVLFNSFGVFVAALFLTFILNEALPIYYRKTCSAASMTLVIGPVTVKNVVLEYSGHYSERSATVVV